MFQNFNSANLDLNVPINRKKIRLQFFWLFYFRLLYNLLKVICDLHFILSHSIDNIQGKQIMCSPLPKIFISYWLTSSQPGGVSSERLGSGGRGEVLA